MFLNHLYGGMDEPELFMCKLRKKLANASNGRNYIETVWGRGYVLREPDVDTGLPGFLVLDARANVNRANPSESP
jgi:two-component system cell cycle response regulator CtrA